MVKARICWKDAAEMACLIDGTELSSNAILSWQQHHGVEWHYTAAQTNAEWLLRLACPDSSDHG
jgi:hypothetical protein